MVRLISFLIAKYRQSDYVDFVSDCYLALGRKDKAIEALKETPDYKRQSNILRKLADIQISDNKTDDAVETLEVLCELFQYDSQSIKKLGHCYFVAISSFIFAWLTSLTLFE